MRAFTALKACVDLIPIRALRIHAVSENPWTTDSTGLPQQWLHDRTLQDDKVSAQFFLPIGPMDFNIWDTLMSESSATGLPSLWDPSWLENSPNALARKESAEIQFSAPGRMSASPSEIPNQWIPTEDPGNGGSYLPVEVIATALSTLTGSRYTYMSSTHIPKTLSGPWHKDIGKSGTVGVWVNISGKELSVNTGEGRANAFKSELSKSQWLLHFPVNREHKADGSGHDEDESVVHFYEPNELDD